MASKRYVLRFNVIEVEKMMALCDRIKAGLQTAQTIRLQLADTLVENAIKQSWRVHSL